MERQAGPIDSLSNLGVTGSTHIARTEGRAGLEPLTTTANRIESNGQRRIEKFYSDKNIHPLASQDIHRKNTEFDARYHDIRVSTRYGGYIIINVYRDKECHEAYYYYQNSIDLANRRIEGLDNQGELDTRDNGPGRMHLSDIKYRSLQEALKWLKNTNDSEFISYKSLSIGDFQPRSLSEKDITHEETKKTILGVIQAYKEKKLKANEHLTQTENDGWFFFLSGQQ